MNRRDFFSLAGCLIGVPSTILLFYGQGRAIVALVIGLMAIIAVLAAFILRAMSSPVWLRLESYAIATIEDDAGKRARVRKLLVLRSLSFSQLENYTYRNISTDGKIVGISSDPDSRIIGKETKSGILEVTVRMMPPVRGFGKRRIWVEVKLEDAFMADVENLALKADGPTKKVVLEVHLPAGVAESARVQRHSGGSSRQLCEPIHFSGASFSWSKKGLLGSTLSGGEYQMEWTRIDRGNSEPAKRG